MHKRALAFSAVALVAAAPCAIAVVLSAVDHGLFTGQIERIASARLGEPVRFQGIRTHLLCAHPTVIVSGLSVAAPPWAGPLPLFRASSLVAKFKLGPLLLGRFEPTVVILSDPVLHLVRYSPGLSSWTLKQGASLGSFGSSERVLISRGAFDLVDRPRDLQLSGSFSQTYRQGEALPFVLDAHGALKGAPVSVQAQGAAISGLVAGPYRFNLRMAAGATKLSFDGQSGRPFNFDKFDLRVRASGPNLADLNDVFGLLTPKSRPYTLIARAQRDGSRLDLTALHARVGQSDIVGDILSNRSGSRPRVRLDLHTGSIDFADLRAMASTRPSSAVSAGVARRAKGRADVAVWDEAFPVARLHQADVDAVLTFGRISGLQPQVTHAAARLLLHGGVLALAPLSIELAPGRIVATARLDARKSVPELQVSGAAENIRIGALHRRVLQTLDGVGDAWFDLRGRGPSPRAVIADASGKISARLRDGNFEKSKAAALSGDLIQAVNLSLADRGARTSLKCAVAEFNALHGSLRVDKLEVVTGAGYATAAGSIELGPRQLALVFHGGPARRKAMQLNAPVTVTGRLTAPEVKLQTWDAIRKAGPIGVLALAVSPLASLLPAAGAATPQPDCHMLLADAAHYVQDVDTGDAKTGALAGQQPQ